MENYDSYYCFESFYMDDERVAFIKGKYYYGRMLNDENGTFRSEISDDHFLVKDFINECLKTTFKFGR